MGDTKAKAAGPELGGYFGQAGWVQGSGRGRRGPGQLPKRCGPTAAGILGPAREVSCRSPDSPRLFHPLQNTRLAGQELQNTLPLLPNPYK